MILVDTSVWIDFLQGHPSKQELILEELIEKEEDVCLCALNVMEILQGIKKKKDFQKTERYLKEFPIVSSDLDEYIIAALIFQKCQLKGHTVKSADCLIAATAIENELILLHKDKDFEYIQQTTYLQTLTV